jgi:hypothetical protein
MINGLHANKSKAQQRKVRAGVKSKAGKPSRSSRSAATAHPTARDPRSEFSDEKWHDMVATAAYYRAESRGFEGGSPEEDWYEAEAQLRERLALAEDEADERAESGLDLRAHRNENHTSE